MNWSEFAEAEQKELRALTRALRVLAPRLRKIVEGDAFEWSNESRPELAAALKELRLIAARAVELGNRLLASAARSDPWVTT